MNESIVQQQLRLVLEQQCAVEFMKLVPRLRRVGFTLLFVDYGEGGNVAFKTSLTIRDLVHSFECLVASWRAGTPRVGFDDPGLPALDELVSISSSIQRPAGVGHVLLVGNGELTSYIASCDREGVQKMLEDELLPAWRRLL